MGNCLPQIRQLVSRGQCGGQRAIWQVEAEPANDFHEGMWLDMWEPWNGILEAAYQTTRSRPHMCHTVELEDYETGYMVYEVDLRTNVQTTNWTGTERRVRRVLAPLA